MTTENIVRRSFFRPRTTFPQLPVENPVDRNRVEWMTLRELIMAMDAYCDAYCGNNTIYINRTPIAHCQTGIITDENGDEHGVEQLFIIDENAINDIATALRRWGNGAEHGWDVTDVLNAVMWCGQNGKPDGEYVTWERVLEIMAWNRTEMWDAVGADTIGWAVAVGWPTRAITARCVLDDDTGNLNIERPVQPPAGAQRVTMTMDHVVGYWWSPEPRKNV